VLLTDGDLGNEEEIFVALRAKLGCPLYTVAIGALQISSWPADGEFGRGTFTHIADIGEIREQMGRLLETMRVRCSRM